jgi:hypothetical protein
MYEMEKFLEFVRDTAMDILQDHRRWFRDSTDYEEVATPDEHYKDVDRRILCLADTLARKAERIRQEQARREAELKAAEQEERQDEVDFCESEFGQEEPNPYSGTYSED